MSAADPPAAVGGNALAGCAAEDHTAFIVATDYQTGSFAAVTLDAGAAGREKANAQRRLHSDARGGARPRRASYSGVNRFFGDNIQVLDPSAGFSISGSARPCPNRIRDIAFASPTKAYISRNREKVLWIVDPHAPPGCDGFKIGEIDLSSLADADRLPRDGSDGAGRRSTLRAHPGISTAPRC